ncbi:hypothetical protein GNP81_15910 [Aliivibrio fischeri]|uniref:hypothetical protein n=1 Tax=Aliivibrio fischeri TaxID=668 RepID=UPI0012D8733C|nr:hypothetical protein [Aliivibrio fischeri]MUK62809.1 hypothetical protein [Aliivibrio fischeri]MUL22291.1 hypothetical protein [Aliivibrio fischeri]MUL26082.1 hypothetical protein [Aliivibrio fischeri]
MSSETFNKNKLSWLAEQVNVDFPTPESLRGKDIYLSQNPCVPTKLEFVNSNISDGVFVLPVTEHRLTIRWAMIVAKQWDKEYDDVLEFLTQIELSEEYQLFVALNGMMPIAACLSQVIDGELFISDIVITDNTLDVDGFLGSVMEQQSSLHGTTFTTCIKA